MMMMMMMMMMVMMMMMMMLNDCDDGDDGDDDDKFVMLNDCNTSVVKCSINVSSFVFIFYHHHLISSYTSWLRLFAGQLYCRVDYHLHHSPVANCHPCAFIA